MDDFTSGSSRLKLQLERAQFTRQIALDRRMSDKETAVSIGGMINDSSSVAQSHVYSEFILPRLHSAVGVNTFCINFTNRNYYKTAMELIAALAPFLEDDYQVTMFSSTAGIMRDKKKYVRFRSDGHEWSITCFGDKKAILDIKNELGKDETKTTLSWWYVDGRGDIDCRNLELVFSTEAHDEYYPYIAGGINAYLERFRNSTAPILLLKGEPGGGKTSFIRHFIKLFNLNTVATYDEAVMSQDGFYINYLTDSNKNLMVIEDADHLLNDRQSEQNKTMSKLLNISDGLIKLEAKKIIFTTNKTDFSKVDDAIIRPGRCFDVIDFRKLTFDEANIAAKVAKMPPLEINREYTLSEIFNRNEKKHKTKVGFLG